MVDAPCLTGARGDDSGQLPVWDNSEGGGLRGDGGYGFGIPGAAAGELGRLLSNTMLAWLLDSLSMQVLVTWHIATGEASSNLVDLNLGGLWFGAKDLAKEARLKLQVAGCLGGLGISRITTDQLWRGPCRAEILLEYFPLYGE